MYDIDETIRIENEDYEAYKLGLDLISDYLKKSIAEEDGEVPASGKVKKRAIKKAGKIKK